MPGTNAGTGQPLTFRCSKQRSQVVYPDKYGGRFPDGHENIVRTGRARLVGYPGVRSLGTAWQYRCECGHVGWSKHVDVLRCPIEETPK